jgi:hypothetical protein
MVVEGRRELLEEKCDRKAEAGEKPPDRLDPVGEGGTTPGSERMDGELDRGNPAILGRVPWYANKACLAAAGGVNEV